MVGERAAERAQSRAARSAAPRARADARAPAHARTCARDANVPQSAMDRGLGALGDWKSHGGTTVPPLHRQV